MIPATTYAPPTVDSPRAMTRDERLQNSVISELHASAYRPIQTIECHVHEDLVILSGRVPSFYIKQVAQTVVMKIAGVKSIENRLRVENENRSS